MSDMNHIYDAETAFRAPKSAALTATGTVGELALDKLSKVRPGSNRNKLGAEGYKLVLNVESIDFVTVTDAGAVPPTLREDYTLTVETGPAGATDTAVFTFKPTAAGNYVFPLDAQTIENLDADRSAIALKLTVDGDVPSIKLNAWLL